MREENRFSRSRHSFADIAYHNAAGGPASIFRYIEMRRTMISRDISRTSARGLDPHEYIEAMQIFEQASQLLRELVADHMDRARGPTEKRPQER